MAGKRIYKVLFFNQGKVYELYAHSVGSASIPGFVEVAELTFGERSALLVDPGEEALKNEFSDAKRLYLPHHSIIRIDEVEKRGTARVTDSNDTGKVMPFPSATSPRQE